MVDDEELLELVEMELRELLSSVRVPGRRHSDRPRLGLKALESDDPDDEWGKKILELIEAGGQLYSAARARRRQALS